MTCLLSCKAQKEGTSASGNEMEDLVLVDHDNFINIDSFETRVIRDAKSLRKFYAQINQTRKPGLPVPMVDFSSEILILVCLGEQQGETVPLLSQVKETEDELLVAVGLSEKERQEKTSNQDIQFPFYLYKLPLVDKTISLQRVDN